MGRLLLPAHLLRSVLWMVHLPAQYGGLRGGRSVTEVSARTHTHTHELHSYSYGQHAALAASC